MGCDRIKLDELAWDALTHAELRYTLRDVALEPFACDPLVRVGSTINRRSTNKIRIATQNKYKHEKI